MIPLRGGNWNNGSNDGAFNLNLNNDRSNANSNIGFRPALRQSQKLAAHGRRPSASLKGSAILGLKPKQKGSPLGVVTAWRTLQRASMPLTYDNLYPRIYEFANLYQAYLRARRGKRTRVEAIRFRRDLEGNLIQIQNELIWKTYRTGAYRTFKVFEPKERIISALPFRDRVVQHAVVGIIEPIWENRFISDSYACRVGKGTHAGADCAQRFLRETEASGRAYVFKADVSKYFASIDHQILKRLLRKRIRCNDTLWLLDALIDSSAVDGVPIGNLASQLFANLYLHELDEFVKGELCERRYVRYMDDFCIVANSKAHLLRQRKRIECFLSDVLGLRLNSKTQIFPVGQRRGRALDFLGYRIWPNHRKLRKSSALRIRRALQHYARLYREGRARICDIQPMVRSWVGHAEHANTYGLREAILGSVAFERKSR